MTHPLKQAADRRREEMTPIGDVSRQIDLSAMLKRIERLAEEMARQPSLNADMRTDLGEIKLRAGIALRCLSGDQ